MLIDPTYDAAPSNVKIMAFSFTRGGQTTVVLGAIAGFAFLTRLPHRRAGPVQHPMDPTMVKTSHWLWHNPDLTNASWLARMSTWASRASPHRFAMALYATNPIRPILICFRWNMVLAGVLGTVAMGLPSTLHRARPAPIEGMSFLGAGASLMSAMFFVKRVKKSALPFATALLAALVFHIWHMAQLWSRWARRTAFAPMRHVLTDSLYA